MEHTKPRRTLKRIKLIYGVLFFSLVICLLIVSLFVSKMSPIGGEDPSISQLLKIIVILQTLVIIPLAQSIPQRIIRKIDSKQNLAEKIEKYQSALIIRFALTEGIGVLASLFFLLSGDMDLMLVIAIILLYFIISRPGNFKLANDLGLTEAEKKVLFEQ